MLSNAALWHQLVLALAGLLMLAAAFKDAHSFRIPNSICFVLLLLFPAHVFLSPEPVTWISHLIVFALALGAGYFLYIKKCAGAGDVKLLAVVSLWAGPGLVGLFLFVTAIAGGLLALMTMGIVTVRHRRARKPGKAVLAKAPVPYGVAIAMGGLCTLMMLVQPALPL